MKIEDKTIVRFIDPANPVNEDGHKNWAKTPALNMPDLQVGDIIVDRGMEYTISRVFKKCLLDANDQVRVYKIADAMNPLAIVERE